MNNTRVFAKLTPEIHEYFFRKVLAGEHHIKQDLIRQFFAALYNECQRRNVPTVWSVENTQLIADIMSHLNFDNESDRSRRPPNQTAQYEGEPPGSPDDPGAANGTGQQASPATTQAPG